MYFLEPGQRRWLTSLNPGFVLGGALLLILFKTTWETSLPTGFRYWDPLLPMTLYLGQRRSTREGILLVIFAAHLFSLASAAPIGVFVVQALVLFAASRLLSYVFYAETSIAVFAMIAGFSLLSRLSLPLIAATFGHGWPVLSFKNINSSVVIFNCIFGMIVYWGLSLLDAMTFKVPPRNIEMADA